MEPFNYIKNLVLNFRLDSCCYIAPVRIGLIITAYFNALLAIICVIGTANESITTVLIQVQNTIMEDSVTKSVPMFAYLTEVGFSVLCLCGIYRKDLVLLRVYMNYCIGSLIMSILVYSIVILAIDVLIQITMISGIVFQLYVLLLVRSAIVEIKWENKQSALPTLIMSSLIHEKETLKDKDEVSIKSHDSKSETRKNQENSQESTEHTDTETQEIKNDDVEKAPENETDKKHIKKDIETKLETVNEEVSP